MSKKIVSLHDRLDDSGHTWYAKAMVLGTVEGFKTFEEAYNRMVELTADWGVSASPEEIAQFIRDNADNP